MLSEGALRQSRGPKATIRTTITSVRTMLGMGWTVYYVSVIFFPVFTAA
jgi:hypothetical protein